MDENLRQDSTSENGASDLTHEPGGATENAAAGTVREPGGVTENVAAAGAAPECGAATRDGIAASACDEAVSAAGNGDAAAAALSGQFCWDDYLGRLFHLPERDYTQYSPLTLAYIGDAVFDVIIRTIVVKQSNMPAARLHSKTSSVVKAPAQAQIIKALLPHLTKEEESVYRRGRNAQPYNTAKNATRREYLEATGFEALIGYLYLRRSYQRMLDLIRTGMVESGQMLTR